MDIAKIRKKEQEKGAAKEPDKKTPVTGFLEKEKNEVSSELPVVEASSVSIEESPVLEIEVKAEVPADTPLDEEAICENTEKPVELLTFSLFHEEYAFRVAVVEEILRLQNITGVPGMPDYMLGITSLRGKIIPVIDLKTRFDFQKKSLTIKNSGECPETETKKTGQKKILIIEGTKGLIGAVVDKVIGVVRLSLDEMLLPPGHLDENKLKFIEGVVVLDKRFISIIHSDAAMDIEDR